jgi:hypothetical protein
MISRYASLRQGLVGAWCPSLGASGFRLIDRSGYNNHGVLTNMDPNTDWVTSGGKGALDFDGVNDFVQFSVPDFGDIASISFYLYLRSNSGNYKTWLHKPSRFDMRTGFFPDNNKYEIVWFYNGSVYTVGTPIIANLNVWQHHCFVANKSSLALYINGVLKDTGRFWFNTPTNPTALIEIGGKSGTASEFSNSQLDDIRVYNRALTPQEINQLYVGGRGVGLIPERIKHRRKTTAAATNRRRRILIGASQ